MNKSNIITAIIIDDSVQARKLLKLMLMELAPEVEIVAEAENGNIALQLLKEQLPDFIFLDIEMPEKSGISLAEEMIKQNIVCPIIFTTAFNDYAIQAFRLSAVDYLLKPIRETELIEAVNRVKTTKEIKQNNQQLIALTENLKPNTDSVIGIPVKNGYDYFQTNLIEYLEADGSYVHIFLADKKQKTVTKNLKYFEQTLSSLKNFKRVHRSFIINVDYLTSFSKVGRGTIHLKSGKLIDLARDRRSEFFEVLKKIS